MPKWLRQFWNARTPNQRMLFAWVAWTLLGWLSVSIFQLIVVRIAPSNGWLWQWFFSVNAVLLYSTTYAPLAWLALTRPVKWRAFGAVVGLQILMFVGAMLLILLSNPWFLDSSLISTYAAYILYSYRFWICTAAFLYLFSQASGVYLATERQPSHQQLTLMKLMAVMAIIAMTFAFVPTTETQEAGPFSWRIPEALTLLQLGWAAVGVLPWIALVVLQLEFSKRTLALSVGVLVVGLLVNEISQIVFTQTVDPDANTQIERTGLLASLFQWLMTYAGIYIALCLAALGGYRVWKDQPASASELNFDQLASEEDEVVVARVIDP